MVGIERDTSPYITDTVSSTFSDLRVADVGQRMFLRVRLRFLRLRWRIPEIMPQWVSGRGRDSGAAICTKKNPMASVPLRHLASVLPSLNAPVDD
jgi:hypothetical protein